jgi:hypothetical protein
MSAQPPLPYATPPPTHEKRRRRRRWLRWIVPALLVVGIAMAIGYRRAVLVRVQLLRGQRQCLTYTRPPDTLLVTSDPKTVLELARNPDYASRTDGPARTHAWLRPQCLNTFPWFRPATIQQMAMGPGPPTVFLHERTSRSGDRRLVYVESHDANALWLTQHVNWYVIRPATLFKGPVIVGQTPPLQYSGMFIPTKLSFGQPDPIDASHFTIDYVIKDRYGGPDRRGTIDAWLRDDDTLHFQLRDPATTQRLIRYSKDK